MVSERRFEELVRTHAGAVSAYAHAVAGDRWTADDFVGRLRHDQSNPAYDLHLRQFVHVAFRVAAEMGAEWTGALEAAREVAGRCVTENLFDRHIRPLFFSSSLGA